MLELLDRQQKLIANQWKIALAATLGDMHCSCRSPAI
jgi:hypothetical protein